MRDGLQGSGGWSAGGRGDERARRRRSREVEVGAPNGQVVTAAVVYVDPIDDVALLRAPELHPSHRAGEPPGRRPRRSPRLSARRPPRLGGRPAGRPTKVFAPTRTTSARACARSCPCAAGCARRLGRTGGQRLRPVVAMMFAASRGRGRGFGIPVSEIGAVWPAARAGRRRALPADDPPRCVATTSVPSTGRPESSRRARAEDRVDRVAHLALAVRDVRFGCLEQVARLAAPFDADHRVRVPWPIATGSPERSSGRARGPRRSVRTRSAR